MTMDDENFLNLAKTLGVSAEAATGNSFDLVIPAPDTAATDSMGFPARVQLLSDKQTVLIELFLLDITLMTPVVRRTIVNALLTLNHASLASFMHEGAINKDNLISIATRRKLAQTSEEDLAEILSQLLNKGAVYRELFLGFQEDLQNAANEQKQRVQDHANNTQ